MTKKELKSPSAIISTGTDVRDDEARSDVARNRQKEEPALVYISLDPELGGDGGQACADNPQAPSVRKDEADPKVVIG